MYKRQLQAAENFGQQSGEKFEINVFDAPVVHGSPEIALQRLLDAQRLHNVDEIMVVTAVNDFSKRLRSYELLSKAATEANIGGITGRGK